jgi:transcriptional regulator with XRE-family HTH domain
MTPLEDAFLNKLGQVIQAHRKGLGLSQEQLAEKAHLHRTYVGAIERGERNITLKNFFKVALALDCKASHLVAEAET